MELSQSTSALSRSADQERKKERSKDGEEECLSGSATSQALLQCASLLAAETVRSS